MRTRNTPRERMEYERIHKVQAGVLSPTKLRMKLLGAHNRVRKSSNNSSRASPSKNMDTTYAQNRLLVGDVLEEVSDSSEGSKGSSAINSAAKSEAPRIDLPLEGNVTNHDTKVQNMSRSSTHQPATSNSSMIHPVRTLEEDSNDYDSGHDNASSSSFEFHGGERVSQNPTAGHFSRQTSSKWNDAEKWIAHRQNVAKGTVQNQSSHQINSTAARGVLAPKASNQNTVAVSASDMKRTNPSFSASRSILEKFSCASHHPNLVGHADVYPVNSDEARVPRYQMEVKLSDSSTANKTRDDPKAGPTVQSVSVRDVGTEMTPIPSQEPSRTGTPLESMTPSRSPNCSMPSTPVGGRSTASPGEASMDGFSYFKRKGSNNELSENEMRLKTRKEIAALGIQLGKMNIATWASKEELELVTTSPRIVDLDQMMKEYEARAAAYEEAENSKHTARFKREEMKIEAWESHRRAKLESEKRKVEEYAERMRTEAMEKMAEKLEITRRLAEEKRASAKARMNQQSARAVQKAEQIRQTGRVPGSHILCCSGFFCDP